MASQHIRDNLQVDKNATINGDLVARNGKTLICGSAAMLASVSAQDSVTNLSEPLDNFSFVVLYSNYKSDVRVPYCFPVSFIKNQMNNVSMLLEGWDGGRWRITLTNTTANVTASYYALPVQIYGVR